MASHTGADALRQDPPTDTFDVLRDPSLQALAHRLTQLAPWPVNPEWLSRTKDELLTQLDQTSDPETT